MKNLIEYSDFDKLEIRVGKVVEVEIPEWSKKLIKMKVDLGKEIGERVIFSGIKEWYEEEDLKEKKFMFLVNMEPKKMGEEESQGMMLMVDEEEKPELIEVGEKVREGSVIR